MGKSISQSGGSLHNKTIVITGASSGAGRAAAVEFAKQKTKLVLAARNINALNQLVIECKGIGEMLLLFKQTQRMRTQ